MSSDISFGGRKSPSVSKQTRRAQMAEERKSVRIQEALERQEERNKRSPQEQLTVLEKREQAAKNVGRIFLATKERTRLIKLIEVEKNTTENVKNQNSKIKKSKEKN